MAKQIFVNEYAVFPVGSKVKIASSDIEQCLFIGCVSEKNYGATHIKPALYLRDDFSLKIKNFLSLFEGDKIRDVVVLGGIDGEGDDEIDGQMIALKALTDYGVSESVIRLFEKYDERHLINAVYDENGIDYERVDGFTRVEQDKSFYADRLLGAKSPSFERRLLLSKERADELESACKFDEEKSRESYEVAAASGESLVGDNTAVKNGVMKF